MADATATATTLGFFGGDGGAAAAAEAAEGAEVPQDDNSSDYDSDVSEGTSALALRRREASDEDEEEEEEDDEEGDGAGAWLDEEENEEYGDESFDRRQQRGKEKEAGKDSGENGDGEAAEEKKEAEPFMVPTTGAFYMHDDRFRDSGGARPRRGMGGRRLWEAKDEKPWVHDMFEELTVGDGESVRRRGRGQGRGRGSGRGRGRGRGGGRATGDESELVLRPQRGTGRARGARNEDSTPAANKDDREMQYVAKKQVGSSSLNSSSPPFFPTGATQSRDDGAHQQEGKRFAGVGARKLTASSSIFVPKVPHGRAESGESSNSLFSQSGSSSRQVAKAAADSHFYSKGRSLAAAAAAGRGKNQSSASRQSAHSEDFQSSSSAARSSPVVGVNATDSGRGSRGSKSSFMYGAAPARETTFSPPQVMSPVLQYGNQSQGGVIVPSMVPQPLYGYGNSDIAWVPVLAGGSGINTGFMSPYIAMDSSSSGMYFAQPSSQPMFRPSPSGELGSNTMWRPAAEASGIASEERQNKPRSSLAKAQSAY